MRMCLLFNPFRVMRFSFPTGLFIFLSFGDLLRVTKFNQKFILAAINISTNNCSFDYFSAH